jgi:histone deacetylase 1/2
VWGPAHISTGGFRYYVSFVDDFSRYTWIYLIKRKSHVEKSFYHFQTHVERLLQIKIRTAQTDGGGEYRRLSRFFSLIGIQHRLTCPHTSKQNGIAERKHMHIVETGIALPAHSSLPIHFVDEAFLTAVYLINRMPTQNLGNSTPLACFRGNNHIILSFVLSDVRVGPT